MRKGQSGEWHHLSEIESRETGVDGTGVSDGTDFDAVRIGKHDSLV